MPEQQVQTPTTQKRQKQKKQKQSTGTPEEGSNAPEATQQQDAESITLSTHVYIANLDSFDNSIQMLQNVHVFILLLHRCAVLYHKEARTSIKK